MATLNKEATLGGLPATKFIGRQIKVNWADNHQHPSTCKCIAVEGDHLVVAVTGGRSHQTRRVPVSRCKPWWSQNPDLKKKAEAAGTLFNGEVSVGRAFEAAEHPEFGEKVQEKALASVQVCPIPETPKVDQAVLLKPVDIPQRPATAPPPVVDILFPSESPPEPQAPPVAEQPQGPRKLARVEVPMEGDGSWLSDMQDYYALRNSLQAGSDELDSIRDQIQKLQATLAQKIEEQRRTKEDNQVMLDLLVEQLEAKGVVFHWEGDESAPPVCSKPAKAGYTEDDEFSQAMRGWLEQRKLPFTFGDLFRELDEEDTALHRAKIRRYCAHLGIKMQVRRGPGAKTTFTPTR